MRALRDPVELADFLVALADAELRQGDGPSALPAGREAVTTYTKVGNLDRPG